MTQGTVERIEIDHYYVFTVAGLDSGKYTRTRTFNGKRSVKVVSETWTVENVVEFRDPMMLMDTSIREHLGKHADLYVLDYEYISGGGGHNDNYNGTRMLVARADIPVEESEVSLLVEFVRVQDEKEAKRLAREAKRLTAEAARAAREAKRLAK